MKGYALTGKVSFTHLVEPISGSGCYSKTPEGIWMCKSTPGRFTQFENSSINGTTDK